MPRALIFGILLFLCGGCAKPYYVQPPLDIPENWRFESNNDSTICNVRWWQQFNDPVLEQLIDAALANNKDIMIAIQRVYEFYGRFGVVGSALIPEIDGNASFTRQKVPLAVFPPTSPEFRLFNIYEGFLSLNYLIDFWGQVKALTEAQYAEYLGSVEARRNVVLTVVGSVANTYILLRQLDLQLKISRETLKSRLQSLDLARIRFELGETSELEVVQAEALMESAAIEIKRLERDIPQTEDLLSILIGFNPQDIPRGLELNEIATPIDIPAGLPSDLLLQRPDVLEAEDRLIAANARVYAAYTNYFPQFTLTGEFGSASTPLHQFLKNPADFWAWGVTGFVPLFYAGKLDFQVMEAKAIYEQAYYNFQQVLLEAFKEVNDALIGVQKNKELLIEQEKQVKVLREYLKLATWRYEEGEVDYLNVLDAERTLFDSELAYATAQADVFTAIIELYTALGGGWVTEADAYAQYSQFEFECCEYQNPF